MENNEDEVSVKPKEKIFMNKLIGMWLIAILGWVLVIVKDTVQAQVVENVKHVTELPVTEKRVAHLEHDVEDIKKDVREQRSDIKYLIRRFDQKYGNK